MKTGVQVTYVITVEVSVADEVTVTVEDTGLGVIVTVFLNDRLAWSVHAWLHPTLVTEYKNRWMRRLHLL